MRILLIEDEARLANIIQRVLRTERFDVDVALTGDDGLNLALSGSYDALIVDRMLPGIEGLEIIRQLRADGVATPALVLTARADLPERVEGLNAGADDYLGKPFAFEELLARLRALLRRIDRPIAPETLNAGEIALNLDQHTVTKRGEAVELTQREYLLLETLLRNQGRVLTRGELLERVWGYDADPQGNVVELYIHYLRRKLDAPSATAASSLIRTVRGVGYQMMAT
jgi:DNA-binding response OmpR family regulator